MSMDAIIKKYGISYEEESVKYLLSVYKSEKVIKLNDTTLEKFFSNDYKYDYKNRLDWIIARKKANKCRGVTQELYYNLYGPKVAEEKWSYYKNKQSETNTFEYKAKKYGMSKEEFTEYNKNRSCTKENLIRRHGKDKGNIIWNDYVERQSYTNTLPYFIDKYGDIEGKIVYERINSQKAHTLENFIRIHGIDEGTRKFNIYINRALPSYSKISQELFWALYTALPDELKDYCYFAELNDEIGRMAKDNKNYFKYDFIITSNINICIEFNGDDWHANPKKYKGTDFIKIKGDGIFASDIWKYDERKINTIISYGFTPLIVWESEYNANKEDVKDILVKIIKDKYNELNNTFLSTTDIFKSLF